MTIYISFLVFLSVFVFFQLSCAQDGELALKFKSFVDEKVFTAASYGYFESKMKFPIDTKESYKCLGAENDTSLHILFLGDSIDRFLVEDFCKIYQEKLTFWPDAQFSYKVGAAPAATCIVGNLTINYLNIYGSKPAGPYLYNHVNTPEDPYADTRLRIPKGLKYIREKFSEPDFIFFRTELWDLHPLSSRYNTSFQESATNFTALIEERQKWNLWDFYYLRKLAPNSYIGTHTVPTITWGLHLFFHLTNNVRYISNKHPWIFNFDWNLLLQSGANPQSYLRDHHHPNPFQTVYFFNFIVNTIQEWMRNTCEVHK